MSSAVEGATARRPSGLPAFLNEHWGTLLVCAFAIWQGSGMGGALLLLPLALLATIWLLVAVPHAVWRRNGRARLQLHKLLLLAVAGLACVLMQQRLAGGARRRGDDAVRAVTAYRAAHGVWPDSLEDASFRQPGLAARERLLYGHHHVDLPTTPPTLTYRSTGTLFDSWDYDFEAHEWVFRPD